MEGDCAACEAELARLRLLLARVEASVVNFARLAREGGRVARLLADLLPLIDDVCAWDRNSPDSRPPHVTIRRMDELVCRFSEEIPG